jgi:hypothetical protein
MFMIPQNQLGMKTVHDTIWISQQICCLKQSCDIILEWANGLVLQQRYSQIRITFISRYDRG